MVARCHQRAGYSALLSVLFLGVVVLKHLQQSFYARNVPFPMYCNKYKIDLVKHITRECGQNGGYYVKSEVSDGVTRDSK